MKYQTLFFIALLFTFIFLGCNDDDVVQNIPIPQPQTILPIQPLSAGSYWNYKDISFNRNGTINDTIDEIRSYGIKMDTMVNGFQAALLISLPECDDCGYGEWLSNQEDGLWHGIPNYSWLRLPYPSHAGVKARGISDEWWVVSTNDSITTPAGKFICYHYKMKYLDEWNGGITNDYYYSPGVGLVRLEWYTILSGSTSYKYIQRELVSYGIK